MKADILNALSQALTKINVGQGHGSSFLECSVAFRQLDNLPDFKVAVEGEPRFSVFDGKMHHLAQAGTIISRKNIGVWLIWRALNTNAETAVDDLWRYLSRRSVSAFQIMEIDGLYVESSDEIYELQGGIKIVSAYNAPVRHIREEGLKPASNSMSGLLVRPVTLTRTIGDTESHFKAEFTDFSDLEDIRLLLSLVTRKGYQAISTFVVAADSVPWLGGASRNLHSRRSPVSMGPPIIGIFVQQADGLMDKFRRLTRSQRERLRVPLEKLNEYWAEGDYVQSAIDLRTCIEALYLDGNTSGELTFRLSLRAANFEGGDLQTRQQSMHAIKKAYKQGSTAVHTGKVNRPKENMDVMNKTAELARNAIIRRLDDPDTDWPSFELSPRE